MRPIVSLAVTALFASCPPPAETDGGTAGGGTSGGRAGGVAGGGTAGGASGGSTAGGVGGGSAGGSAGGATPLDPAAFCESRAQLDVTYQVTCGYLDPAQRDDALYDSRTGCLSRSRLLDAGSVTWQPAAAAACLARYDGGCTDFSLDPFRECSLTRVFTGAAVLGAPCGTPTDCVNGSCFGTSELCAACIPYRQIGDVCDPGRACDPSTAFCSFLPAADGGRRCKPAVDAGAFCTEFNSCKDGASCLMLVDGGRACGPLPLGAECTSIDNFTFKHCGPAAYCRGLLSGVRNGSCTTRLAMGAACTNEQQDDGCPAGSSCLDGTCTPVFYSRLRGQTCDAPQQCVISDTCDVELARGIDGGAIVDGHCVARPGLDAGCPRGECASPLTCSMSACAARPRAGDSCDVSFTPCGNSLRCVRVEEDAGYFCLPRRDAGSPCEAYQDVCRAGFCPSGQSAPVCQPLLPVGSACLTSLDCETSRCAQPSDSGTARCAAVCL